MIGKFPNAHSIAKMSRILTGEKFNLKDFTDPETGIITVKNVENQEILALELPGLWNGGMAHWLTLFVDVPLHTFNPVKTVFDLLRPEHQPIH